MDAVPVTQFLDTSTLTVTQDEFGPTRTSERIVEVDIVRGIALFGIVLVNYQSPTLTGVVIHNSSDRLISLVVAMFFNGKFYPLFSLLFGFGMAIQMFRAQAGGGRFSTFYLRRLAVLFGLGLLNSVLVWKGDILHVYAFLGVFLLLLSNVSNKSLLIAAALLIAIVGFQKPLLNVFHFSGTGALGDLHPAPYTSSDYSNMVVYRTQKLIRDSTDPKAIIALADILGMFLLGLYAGRRRVFQETAKNIHFVRRVMWSALALGVLGLGWGSILKRLSWLARDGYALGKVVHFLSKPSVTMIGTLYYQQALAVSYGFLVLLLLRRSIWLKLLQPFAGIGRMALTNYLAQCVLASMLFFGYGVGLYGKLGAAWGAALAVGVYVLQLPFSAWWLKHFRFGPMEWVWRSLTYGKAQPLRAS